LKITKNTMHIAASGKDSKVIFSALPCDGGGRHTYANSRIVLKYDSQGPFSRNQNL
jgi:hypothetical protein